jgi:hypothetical protein
VTRSNGITELQCFSILFEKAGSSHKCFGSRPIPVSPNDTIDTIIDRAKAYFPGSHLRGHFDVYEVRVCRSFVRICISLRDLQLVGERESLRGAMPKEIEAEVLLNGDYLDKNAVRRIPQDPLRTLTNNTLLVIFGALLRSSLKSSLIPSWSQSMGKVGIRSGH